MNTQESVSSLEKLYKRYHFSFIAVIILLIAALGCTFINRIASVVVGIIAFAVFFAVTTPAKKKYKEKTTVLNILLTVGKKIGARTVEPKHVTVLTEEIIKNANLLPVDTDLAKPYLAWGLSGEDAKYRVALSDVSLTQRVPDAPRTKSANFTAGVWTHIDLPFDSGRDYRLIDPKMLPDTILTPFLENAGLSKSTAKAEGGKTEFIFANKSGDGGLPGTAALAKLEELAAYTPGATALSLRGRTLDVFVMNRFLSTEVNARIQPSDKRLEFNPYPELNRILALAMSLRQDL